MDRESDFRWDAAEEFPHLAAAPIVEAVIEWRARAEHWPADDLRAKLVERLPDYPQCHPQQRVEFQAAASAENTAARVQQDREHGVRFESADQRQIAQFTRDGFAFSRLQPYENWERFSSEARRLWRIFVELVLPTEIQRLGVRFINRLALVSFADAGSWLAQAPRRVKSLQLPVTRFWYHTTYEVPQHPYQVSLIETIQPNAPGDVGAAGLVLDIDVVTTAPLPLDDERLQLSLQQMRKLKNSAFFGLLKKRRIELLERSPA